MQSETRNRLQDHVDQIAHDLDHGINYETCPDCGGDLDHANFEDVRDPCQGCEFYHGMVQSGFEHLKNALDIQYIVTGSGEYIAARILVAFGGPNIWINTQTKTVEGYWWGDSAFAPYYDDAMDIDGACAELWDCR